MPEWCRCGRGWGYKQAAPRGSPELQGEVKQRQNGWAICRGLASRLSRSQQKASRNSSMSRNRPLSFELGRTIAHITVKPLNEESYSSCFHLPASEEGGLPSQQRRSLGLALTLHLSLPVPRALQPLDSSASRANCHRHIPNNNKKKAGWAGLEGREASEAPSADARTLGLCSVKGSEACGLELNLLATVPQFPSLVSGLPPATSEASVSPSHHTATPSPFLTISCHNCSPRPCPSPHFDSTKDAAPRRHTHHLPTVTQEEPDVPAGPRDATASSSRTLDPLSPASHSPPGRGISAYYTAPHFTA